VTGRGGASAREAGLDGISAAATRGDLSRVTGPPVREEGRCSNAGMGGRDSNIGDGFLRDPLDGPLGGPAGAVCAIGAGGSAARGGVTVRSGAVGAVARARAALVGRRGGSKELYD
jgi:hypothetical protein